MGIEPAMRCGLIPRLLEVSPQLEPPGAGDEAEGEQPPEGKGE